MEFIKTMLSYFFYPVPGVQFKFYLPMLILAAILIIGGMVFGKIYKRMKKEDQSFKRLFPKTANQLVLSGLLILFLTAVRYEKIPYFSMRIWIYLSLIWVLYLAYKNIKNYKVKYPQEKLFEESKKHVSKNHSYLPNK
ncbi:MAG: hypothetical protein IT284_01485 [Bacteroidetes bacterium]|nr:hypothetical protein [Bacteroidota bacterium]